MNFSAELNALCPVVSWLWKVMLMAKVSVLDRPDTSRKMFTNQPELSVVTIYYK